MKIFLLSRWFVRWNGAAVTTYELSKRFCKKNDVTVITYEVNFDRQWAANIKDQVRIICIKENPLDVKSLILTSNLIRKDRPDIVHSQGLMGLSAWRVHCPYVSTYHGEWPMNWFLSWKHFVAGLCLTPVHYLELKKANKVVTISKFTQYSLAKYFNIKSTLIYNGIADEFLLDANMRLDDQIKDFPILIFVGSICMKKAKILLPIAKKLFKAEPKIRIKVVGKPLDHNLVAKLSRLPNVCIIGYVQSVKPCIDQADVCILPSLSENLPYTVLEAQARGKPVVAFDVGGISEIVEDGQTGFVVPKGDVEAFIYRIQELIFDKEKIREMGRKAKNSVKTKISWDKAACRYMKIYEDVISRST